MSADALDEIYVVYMEAGPSAGRPPESGPVRPGWSQIERGMHEPSLRVLAAVAEALSLTR